MSPRLTKNAGDALRAAGALSTVGLSFVFSLAIGFWLGTVVDRWLGTRPLFTIVMFFVGLAAGVLSVYRIVSQAYTPTSSAGGPGQPPVAAPPANDPPPVNDPPDRDLYDDSTR